MTYAIILFAACGIPALEIGACKWGGGQMVGVEGGRVLPATLPADLQTKSEPVFAVSWPSI